MKSILVFVLALVLIGGCASARSISSNASATSERSKTEVMRHLASMPEVSVTYLTKSMLQRLSKNKSDGPLAMLVDKGGAESVRVFQLGSLEAEAEGKKLIDSYLSDTDELNYAELLMSQKNESTDVVIYGFPIYNDHLYYNTILMYSKSSGKKAVLLIIKGKIHENAIGDLIDSFAI